MELKKELGLLEVFCVSSGAMISSGLFILPAIAYAKAGPAMILAYILASLLIIPTLLSKSELATAMPKTGGVYFFTDRSMGPMMGTLGGMAAWFSLAFKSAFALLGMGIFMTLLYPGFTTMQIKLIAVGFIIIFTLINLREVKLAAKLQVGMVVLLIALMVVYVIIGLFFVKMNRFDDFAPKGYGAVLATTGMVFVSFAGTTKVAAIAGEVKNPGRNLPLGMFLSWSIVSTLYFFVIFVTVGVTNPGDLSNSLTPISLGADVTMGVVGVVILSIAAILAFVSTGNAGILAASRDPMAMSKDGLLPNFFGEVSERGTPKYSIVFTSGFMILVVMALDLEDFVKTASTLMLILFILNNLAIIFMREGNIRYYHPRYKAPFYPWIQFIGIGAYTILIFQMGPVPIITAGIFLLFGLGWYFFYAYGKIKREYALLHVIERLTGIKHTSPKLNEELRECLMERDNISEKRFEHKLNSATTLDMEYFVSPWELSRIVASKLSTNLDIPEDELYNRLVRKGMDSNIFVNPGFAVISLQIKGRNKFEMALIKAEKGTFFSKDMPPARVAFVVVSSPDEQNFYYHSLMWLLQITESIELVESIPEIETAEDLRDLMMESWRNRTFDFDMKMD